MSTMRPIKVMTYNILADELSSNLVPRTMEEPSQEVLLEIFGKDYALRWREVDKALNDEYRKWHPMKTMVTSPEGLKMKSRGLWGELDLTALEGWDLQGVHVEDAVTLDGGKTFLGVVQRFLDPEQSLKLYWALYRVHVESRAWNARGPRILERMAQQRPTLLALQEYDMHSLATGSYGSFREAMDGLGYDGALFLGPGQEKVGLGLFWLKDRASLPVALPEDRRLVCGSETDAYGNIDLQEDLERPMDRRMLAYVKLMLDSQPMLFCASHLMTSSRDKDGQIRKQELLTIRELLEARSSEPTVLCGDFNINLRKGLDEHIFLGTGCERQGDERRLRWRGRGRDLVLRDAFDDLNGLEASSSTRTGTRLETIDFIFYEEQFFTVLERSSLQCPMEAMPNGTEPSDHIPVVVTLGAREA